MPDKPSMITRGTLVPIGFVAAIVAVGVTGLWAIKDAEHAIELKLVQIDTRLEGIHKELLSRTGDRWRQSDMKHWAELLKAHNPGLTIPEPQAQFKEVE